MTRNVISSNSMIDAFDKAGQWRQALWSCITGSLEVVGFNSAISACEESVQWQKAIGLFKILQYHVRADVSHGMHPPEFLRYVFVGRNGS